MYESHFGLSARPFDLTPNPGFLYLGRKHSLALALLEYSIVSQAAVTVITGEIGSGKTTLLYHLLTKVPNGTEISLVSQTPSTLHDLIGWVLADRALPSEPAGPADHHRRFIRFIEDFGAQGGRFILLVDEAQNLDVATLEGIRMLTNVNHGGRVALQLVLVGQPELLEKLRRKDLKQLAQRVSIDFHLDGLEEAETVDYIGHRLAVAGGDGGIFPEDARHAVHRASGGLPRLINALCDLGLVYAFAEGRRSVTSELMEAVVSDRRAGGVMPLTPQVGAGSSRLLSEAAEALAREVVSHNR